jgi:DNA-binding MarR family transcriptional regulator
MQQLQNASEARGDTARCAAAVLEAVLEVLVSVRETCARRHEDGPSLMRMRALGFLRKRPGASLSMLSVQLALTLSATSRLVDGLVEEKLVARAVLAGNRRKVELALTAAGLRMHQAAFKEAMADLARPLGKLPAARRVALTRAMEELRGVMEAESRRKE